MANIIDIIIRSKDQTGDGIASASKSGNVLTGVFQGIGQAAGNILADLPSQAIGFFKGAIDAASDLGETVSKNKTIFGDASKELMVWAEGAPKSLGMTKQAALDATGTLGNLFTQLGVNTDAARKMSQANVQLATDFASFHNADPTDVLEAMTAAYRGEFDAVQRFVPLLNAANVEEKALMMTKKASKDALTEQDKALAVNAMMMEGAGAAAGDFARTSDSAANQSRIAAASFEEMKTKIGNALLPAWTALLSFITGSFFPAIEGVASWLSNVLGPIWEEVSGGVQAFAAAFSAADGDITSSGFPGFMERLGYLASQVWGEIKGGFLAMVAAFQSGDGDITSSGFPGFMERVGYIARLVFDWLQANVPPIMEAVGNAFQTVVDKVSPFWTAIEANQSILITLAIIIGTIVISAVVALTASMASLAVSVIAATWPFIAIVAAIAAVVAALMYAYNNWEWFRNGVNMVVQWLIANVPPILEMIRVAVQVAFEWIANVAVPFIQQAFGSFMGFLQGTLLPAVTTVWNGIYMAVETAVNIIKPIIDFLVGFIQQSFGHIAEIAQNVWDMIRNVISNTWQIISNIIQFWLNVISGNWSGALENFKNIWSGAFDMIRNIVANGLGIVREQLQMIIHFIGEIGGRIGEGLVNAGRSLIEGLWRGVSEKIGWVKDKIGGALGSIRNLFPFSPAKEGPFSGTGYTTHSGAHLAEDFAKGFASREGVLHAAVEAVLRSVQASMGPGAYGMADAARDALGGLGGGGKFFEDFAFTGMGGAYKSGGWYSKLADAFYASHPGFDFGGADTTPVVRSFLERMAAGGMGAQHNWYVQGSIRSDQDLVALIRDEFLRMGFAGAPPPVPAGVGGAM